MPQRYVAALTPTSISLCSRGVPCACFRMKLRTLVADSDLTIIVSACEYCVLIWAPFSAAVVSAKKKTTFELFCVPIFPLSSKHVWACGICQWMVPLQQGCVVTSFPTPLHPSPPFCYLTTYTYLDGSRRSLGCRDHLPGNGNRVRLPVNGNKDHLRVPDNGNRHHPPVNSSRGITQLILLPCQKGALPPSSPYLFHTRLPHPIRIHDVGQVFTLPRRSMYHAVRFSQMYCSYCCAFLTWLSSFTMTLEIWNSSVSSCVGP